MHYGEVASVHSFSCFISETTLSFLTKFSAGGINWPNVLFMSVVQTSFKTEIHILISNLRMNVSYPQKPSNKNAPVHLRLLFKV